MALERGLPALSALYPSPPSSSPTQKTTKSKAPQRPSGSKLLLLPRNQLEVVIPTMTSTSLHGIAKPTFSSSSALTTTKEGLLESEGLIVDRHRQPVDTVSSNTFSIKVDSDFDVCS